MFELARDALTPVFERLQEIHDEYMGPSTPESVKSDYY